MKEEIEKAREAMWEAMKQKARNDTTLAALRETFQDVLRERNEALGFLAVLWELHEIEPRARKLMTQVDALNVVIADSSEDIEILLAKDKEMPF